jgi:cytochrome c oxidase assembly protein Cox11
MVVSVNGLFCKVLNVSFAFVFLCDLLCIPLSAGRFVVQYDSIYHKGTLRFSRRIIISFSGNPIRKVLKELFGN